MTTLTGKILRVHYTGMHARVQLPDGSDIFIHKYDIRPVYHDGFHPFFDEEEKHRGARPYYVRTFEEEVEVVFEIDESACGQPKAFPWAYRDPVDELSFPLVY
jgi:hypothetical protein